jgi:hypothetical protein
MIPFSVPRCLVIALVLAVAFPTESRAAPSEFVAIRVDEGLVYIGVGRSNGVAPGQALEVIGREGNDESFHLGWIVLESCGDTVSLARIPTDLGPYIKKGTILRLPGTSAPPPPPQPRVDTTSKPTTSTTPIAVGPPLPAAPVGAPIFTPGFRHQAPSLVAPGVPLTLSVYAPPPLGTPVLMYRVAGEHAYTALPFTAQPDSYYLARVAADIVQAPALEYYITVDAPDAPRRLAYATPEEPQRVSVEGRFNETAELARYGVRDEIAINSELVTYHLGSGTSDYYYHLEGDYLHRIFEGVYSMRFGAGYLSGEATTDAMTRSKVGFLYAYSEAEFRSSSFPIAFIPRVIFGVNDGGVGGGFEARIRLGDELGMNFEGGVTVLSQLGFETFTTLTLHPTKRASIALAAYLENLPLDDQLGFRSYVDLRYRFQRSTSVTLRLGVAARSIDTIGPDTGLGLAWGF